MEPTPLILDVDTGVDDALAILYALASPEVTLIGATTVMGNVDVDHTTENTLAVLELCGYADVEVAKGAGRPLVRDHMAFPVVHGARGLGEAELPPASRAPSDRDAAQLLVETARERPGEVLLVATGPLTNVALALAEEPALPELLKGFAIMGGAFDHQGNVTPAAEANIWVDPEAAQAVFRGFAGAARGQAPRGRRARRHRTREARPRRRERDVRARAGFAARRVPARSRPVLHRVLRAVRLERGRVDARPARAGDRDRPVARDAADDARRGRDGRDVDARRDRDRPARDPSQPVAHRMDARGQRARGPRRRRARVHDALRRTAARRSSRRAREATR